MSQSAVIDRSSKPDTDTEPTVHLTARWEINAVTVTTGDKPVSIESRLAQPYTFQGHSVRHAQPGVPYSDRLAELDVGITVAYADGTGNSWTEHANHGYFTYDAGIVLETGKPGTVTMRAVATDAADPDSKTPSITIKVSFGGV